MAQVFCIVPTINGQKRITTSPNSQQHEIASTYNSLTKRLKHHQHLLGQFMCHWRLDEQDAKNASAPGVKTKVKVSHVAQTFWKLAKVEKLLPGRNGLGRPIQHLIPTKVKTYTESSLHIQRTVFVRSYCK